jgi:hypothetical protein
MADAGSVGVTAVPPTGTVETSRVEHLGGELVIGLIPAVGH